MKHYISITIGRNIGNEPMKQGEWSDFVNETLYALEERAEINEGIFDGVGFGLWGKKREKSHALIVLADKVNQPALRQDLASLAKKYGQEAIGCAIVELPNGDETLVFAK